MSPREHVGLRPPRPGDAEQVPTTYRRRPLHRAVDQRHTQPWWFSTRSQNPSPGRFDLAAPGGTCYLALSPATAIIERTADPDAGDSPVITTRSLARLRVWSGRLDSARDLADTTRPSVPTLTAEIAAVVPYEVPWAWADAFRDAGRNGLLYRPRFTGDESVALFCDLTGAPAPDRPDDPRNRGRLEPTPAADHVHDLPPAFLEGIGDVGTLHRYPRAPAP